MKTYSIKDYTYNQLYKVYIGDDPEELIKKSGICVDQPFRAATGEIDDHIALCFLEENEHFSANINAIVHEAYHAMFYAFTSRGVTIEDENHEHVAYYLGWLTEQLYYTIYKHDKRRKTSNTE